MNAASERARYARIKAIFDAALEHPGTQRASFLARACGDDAALRAELVSLLAAHDTAATDFLATPSRAEEHVDPATLGLDRGWRVLRELARGGMGVVYLAERADGAYAQQVAIKLLSPAAALSAEAVLRLKLERQILARLNHPNIARLLDGGTAANGVPYLVMEYVEGERLDRWSAARPDTVDATLLLFLKICDAVAYAHRNLVVHRDLKPGNVIVTAEGEPKLLDFGIAKLLEGEDAAVTREGERMLTPRYASPEQVRGEAVTTLSDVYSLGVILYELLAGISPYGAVVSAPLLLPRAICEHDPSAPSTSAVDTGAEAQAVGASASEDRRRRARALRGDLDAIVLKALRKEPGARYPSVEALADDLRAHRAGLPVAARRGSRAYRARKFVRRHWIALSTAAGVVALTLVFVIGLARQLERTEIERDKARAVTGFMVDMFEGGDPLSDQTRDSARSASVTVREVLETNAPRIERELAAQPEVQATLLAAVARVYNGMGLLEPARRYMQAALARYPAGGAPRRETAEARLYLGQVEAGLGELDAAMRTAELALAETRSLARGDDFDVARALRLRGAVLLRRGRSAEARRDLEEALATLQRLYGADHPYIAGTLKDLAELAHREGDFGACETLARDAYERWQRHFGPRHAVLGAALTQRAACLAQLGRADEAEAAYRAVLAVYRETLGPRNPSVGLVLNDLGLLENQRGRYAEAEALLHEALAILRENFGETHPRFGITLTNLATAVGQLGRVEESVTLLERALQISATGGDTQMHAIGLNNLGYKLRQLGRDADAEARFRAALAIFDEVAHDHPDRATALINLGRLLTETGRAASAEAMLREGLAIRSAKLPPEHWLTSDARSVLGQCLAARDRRAEAEPLLRQGHAELLAALGAAHERTVRAAQRVQEFERAAR